MNSGPTSLNPDSTGSDSFGDRVAKIKNWKQFISLQFDVFNPSRNTVRLTLTVKHRRTTSYQTRVDVPIVLKPGKNSVTIGVDEMLNVNGVSAANVVRRNGWIRPVPMTSTLRWELYRQESIGIPHAGIARGEFRFAFSWFSGEKWRAGSLPYRKFNPIT